MDAAKLVCAADDRPWARSIAPLRTVIAVASFCGLLLFGGVVVARWWASGFSAPLGAAAMFAAGCFLATLARAASGWLTHLTSEYSGEAGRNVARWAPLAMAAISALALLAGAWSPGNMAVIVAPLVVVGLASVPMIQSRVRQVVDGVRQRAHCGRRILLPTGAPRDSESNAADSRDQALSEDDDKGVTQRWTRRMVDGWDTLEGWQQASIERGARVVQMHVAICPAFAGMPEASVEQIDGEAASVRVAEATAFGLRVEARLDEPANDAGSLTVAIMARATILTAGQVGSGTREIP